MPRRGSRSPPVAEKDSLTGCEPSRFARPSLAVDVVLLSAVQGELFTLLYQRREHPFKGCWALPGTFVRIDEPLVSAAQRVLQGKCAVDNVALEQLHTFDAPDRDPRTRVVSVTYVALVDPQRFEESHTAPHPVRVASVIPSAGGAPARPSGSRSVRAAVEVRVDAEHATLAFDHAEIVAMAVRLLRREVHRAPIGSHLLPERFTLLDLRRVHEAVLGRALNKDSFRRRMLASELLEPTGERQVDVSHRPAELFRFREPSKF